MQPYKVLDNNEEENDLEKVLRKNGIQQNTLPPERRIQSISSIQKIILLAVVLLLLFAISSVQQQTVLHRDNNVHDCDIRIVESIPIGLNYTPNSPAFMSTFEAWNWLIDNATTSLDIGSFYWDLRGSDTDMANETTAAQGEAIFNRLLANANGAKQKINIRIAQSQPTDISPNSDTKILASYNAANVVSLNFPKYFGGGVLHTKLWIVDNKHFYLGSANMDWRSLTQVKELGVLAQNCPDLAADMAKIFKAYWYLGSNENAKVPDDWNYDYSTDYNVNQPMLINVTKKYTMKGYISSAPPPLSARGRTHDLDAILNVIQTAVEFIHISVMDYYPLIIYGPQAKYWPAIDTALREAAINRKVAIKMLISWWPHSNPSEDNYLRSLQDLASTKGHIDIEIRRFIVPANDEQKKIPFARVNHNKYMVTERVAYIGTSNWSGDYFTDTAGIGLVLQDTLASARTNSVRRDLQNIFARDWNSSYTHPLSQH